MINDAVVQGVIVITGLRLNVNCWGGDPHNGQPARSWNNDNVKQMLEAVHSDQFQTIEMTAQKGPL
jgi:hypothetical protein